jgi:hypothetical protein
VVIPLLKEVLGLAKTAMLTAAPTKGASELIAKETDSQYGATDYEALINLLENKSLPPAVSVIVLDEAGALSIPELTRLTTALVRYNDTSTTKVKLVMVYDPAQLTTGDNATASIDAKRFYEVPSPINDYHSGTPEVKEGYKKAKVDNPELGKGVGVPFVHHMYDLSPLSTTFRSPLTEIVELQNAFKSSETVSQVRTSSNATTKDMTNALGTVAASSPAHLIATIVQSTNDNRALARTRMVVVGSEDKKRKYTEDLKNANVQDVSVLTVEESRGLNADEVYVDVVETDARAYRIPKKLNQAIYTATSRAIKFIYLTNVQSGKHVHDPSLPSKLEAIQQAQESKYAELIERLKERVEAFKALGEEVVVPPPTTPQEAPEVTEPLTEEEASEDFATDIPEEITPTPPTDPSVNRHTIRRPQSEVFGTTKLQPITPGTEVYFVRNVDSNGERIEMYVQHTPTLWRLVGILEDSEVEEVSTKIGANLRELPETQVRKAPFSEDTTQRNIFELSTPPSHFANARIGVNSHDIIYHYGGEATAMFASTPEDPNGLQHYAK